MSRAYDIAAFRERIGAIKCEDNPVLVKQKSRDFYWYSPVLKRELEAVDRRHRRHADERSGSRATVLAAAHGLGIPVTPRGGGTGNYGQAMPLTGGVLLNLTEMNKVLSIQPGRVVCEPGAIMLDVDKAAAPRAARNCACSPRPARPPRSRGFVAGGSGGVGSITWGGLRDFGNVLRLRVLTMEAEPRALELTGEDLHKAVHAYGTNGDHHRGRDAARRRDTTGSTSSSGSTVSTPQPLMALALGEQDGILKKLVTVVAAPDAARLFPAPSRPHPAGRQRRHSDDRPARARRLRSIHPTVPRRARSSSTSSRASPETLAGLPPNYELTWNHTTLARAACRSRNHLSSGRAIRPMAGSS